MPDDELLSLAEAGKLHVPGTLDAQVKRMLADPRSSALADNFAAQWLETRNLDVVKPDPQKFPEWNPELRDAMRTETTMFFDYILRQNRPMADFLDARYTFLNERLAQPLRDRRRQGPRVSQGGPDHRSARRHAGPGRRAHGFELSHAHLGGDSRQVHSAEDSGNPAAPAAARRSAARRGRRGNLAFPAPANGKAPRQRRVRLVPLQDGPAGLRPGELRRHRQMADHGRQVPGGCRAARCPTARRFATRRKCARRWPRSVPQFARAWWRSS